MSNYIGLWESVNTRCSVDPKGPIDDDVATYRYDIGKDGFPLLKSVRLEHFDNKGKLVGHEESSYILSAIRPSTILVDHWPPQAIRRDLAATGEMVVMDFNCLCGGVGGRRCTDNFEASVIFRQFRHPQQRTRWKGQFMKSMPRQRHHPHRNAGGNCDHWRADRPVNTGRCKGTATSAARTQCANNLKQVGLKAAQQFHNANKTFPAGMHFKSGGRYMSWLTQICCHISIKGR